MSDLGPCLVMVNMIEALQKHVPQTLQALAKRVGIGLGLGGDDEQQWQERVPAVGTLSPFCPSPFRPFLSSFRPLSPFFALLPFI